MSGLPLRQSIHTAEALPFPSIPMAGAQCPECKSARGVMLVFSLKNLCAKRRLPEIETLSIQSSLPCSQSARLSSVQVYTPLGWTTTSAARGRGDIVACGGGGLAADLSTGKLDGVAFAWNGCTPGAGCPHDESNSDRPNNRAKAVSREGFIPNLHAGIEVKDAEDKANDNGRAGSLTPLAVVMGMHCIHSTSSTASSRRLHTQRRNSEVGAGTYAEDYGWVVLSEVLYDDLDA